MQIETTHGSVTFSRASGEQLLRVFSARWSMPVVALSSGSDTDAAYGVVFQLDGAEAWCFLHLLPREVGSGVEVILSLLEKAMSEALCRLAEWRPPGALLPCACLLENDDGSVSPGMAVFTSDALQEVSAGRAHSELCDAFVDVIATTPSGALLPPFGPSRHVPRLEAGAIKFDTALVDGAPLCFRQQPTNTADEEDQRELATIWARERVKHLAWAPAIPIFLSRDEAAALGVLPVESPPIESPPVESPPVEFQPVEFQPVESPPIESPPVESPPVAEPTTDLLSASEPAIQPPPPTRRPQFAPSGGRPHTAISSDSGGGPLPEFGAAAPSEITISTVDDDADDATTDKPTAHDSDVGPSVGESFTLPATVGPSLFDTADTTSADKVGDSDTWGPTVMDLNSVMRNTADRHTLIRLRGETISPDAGADADADAAAREAAAESIAPVEPLQDDLLPTSDEAPAAASGSDQSFKSTHPGASAQGRTTLVGAPTSQATVTPVDSPTTDAPTGTATDDLSPRITDEYQTASLLQVDESAAAPAVLTAAETSRSDRAGEGPAMLQRLSATSWASIHRFASDRAHAAMVYSALAFMLEADRWPDSLPAADQLGREGVDIHLISGARVVGVVAIRLGRDIDAIALAESRAAADGADGALFTLEQLNPALVPPGWTSRSIDDLANWVAHLDDDPVAAEHAFSLSQLAAVRDAFTHDALADASPWSSALTDSAFSGSLVQILHRDVIAEVALGLGKHGWQQLDHEAVSRGVAPTQRVFDATVRMRAGQVFSEVSIVDPASPHSYGVRGVAGRVLIFAEAFDKRVCGVDLTLAWGRRNELLRAVCGLLQIDTKLIEGQATDATRSVEIDSYDLLRADARNALAQTLVETSWVLWGRTHEGRFTRR